MFKDRLICGFDSCSRPRASLLTRTASEEALKAPPRKQPVVEAPDDAIFSADVGSPLEGRHRRGLERRRPRSRAGNAVTEGGRLVAPARILALTKSTGGLAHYNRMLLSLLEGGDLTTHTICLSDGAEAYAASLLSQGLSAEPCAMARYSIDPKGDLRVLRHVMRVARDRQIDAVICHGSKAGFLGRAAACALRLPAVYCQASMPFLRRIQGRRAPAYWALEFVARSFNGIIVTLTEGARRETLAKRLAKPERIMVIRTGIDVERFQPRGLRDEVVREFGLDPARPVVGWMGRLEPQKAPLDFVDAIARVADRHAAAQFVIAGEGGLRQAVRDRLDACALSDRVRLLPWQADTARTFQGFDVYALSSLWEGLPLTLLEAMASGCATISTDADGCSEVIEDEVSGRLVPRARPAAMADALDGMIASPERRSLYGRAARHRVVEHFEKRQMAARWKALLRSLTAGVHEPDQRDASGHVGAGGPARSATAEEAGGD